MWARDIYRISFLILLLNLGLANSTQTVFANPIEPTKASNQTATIPIAFFKAYQYPTNNENQNDSPIVSKLFFFSPEGKINPRKEWEAAIHAYENDQPIYRVEKTYAACAFPARKQIIETHLNIKFKPVSDCKDLHTWLNRLNADRISIIFAGTYSGNPASIMGHTFLRLYHHTERSGNPLLSFAVGFLANTTADDNQMTYMWKGLTGQYLGGYEIESYYQKVGLYNNSESRDLWEYELNLSASEVQLITKYIWELTFNSEIPYYFLDENCSFRLLKLFEVARPELNFNKITDIVVLPSETVRTLYEIDILKDPLQYRSSLKTRLDYRFQHLDKFQQAQFNFAINSKKNLTNIEDPFVLDTLIDYWNIKNYKALTQLTDSEKELMTFTLEKRLSQSAISPDIDERDIQKFTHSNPPFIGHKNSRINFGLGKQHQSIIGYINYRMGAHSLLSSPIGYENVSAIEYLGFDVITEFLTKEKEYKTAFNAVIIDALDLEDFTSLNSRPSWGFKVTFGNENHEFANTYTSLKLSAKAGLSKKITRFFQPYILASICNQLFYERELQNSLLYGYELGILTSLDTFSFQLNRQNLYNKNINYQEWLFQLNYHWKINSDLTLAALSNKTLFDQDAATSTRKNDSLVLGYQLHF